MLSILAGLSIWAVPALLLSLLFAPQDPWLHLYVPVAAQVTHWGDAKYLRAHSWSCDEDHLVRNGRLYLRVQSTQNTMLCVFVDAPGWDAARVTSYRREHPELEALWPEHQITWLRPPTR